METELDLESIKRFFNTPTSLSQGAVGGLNSYSILSQEQLSIAYMLLAWNAFGFVAYSWYMGRGDWADYYGLKTEEDKNMPNNEYFARTIGRSGTTKLITMRGFSVVENKDFDYDAEKEKERELVPEQRPLNMEERIARKRRLIEAELARRHSGEEDNSQ